MLHARSRGVVVSAAVLTISAGVAAPLAFAAGGSAVTGGNVKISLSSAESKAFDHKNIAVHATGAASFKKSTLKFPISRGKANPPSYVVKTAGGFKLTSASGSVKVTHLKVVVDGTTGTATGKAKIGKHKLSKVFTFSSPNGGNGGPGEVQIGYDDVTLTAHAQKAFDNALSTSVFNAHPTLGAGYLDIKFAA